MEWVTDKDRQWMEDHYPEFSFQEGVPLVLTGVLKFDMLCDSKKGQYVINPEDGADFQGERIKDFYDIEIRFETSEFSSLPQVYERGGRIDRVAQTRKIKRVDLHINPNGAACLCLKTKEKEYLPNGFYFPDYLQKLVIPFFYGQSYFEKHNRWPWGEYSHGDLGYLEGYGENDEQTTIESVRECITLLKKYGQWVLYEKLLTEKRKLKIHRYQCFCGSKRKIRKCHSKVFRGLCKLKEDIASFGIEI